MSCPRERRSELLDAGYSLVAAIPGPALIALLAIALAIVPKPAHVAGRTVPDEGAELRGTVVEVIDGDTFELRGAELRVTVRLHGVDAPESNQAYGAAATRLVRRLVGNATVTLHVLDLDRYGRAVGRVILEDGRELNRLLLHKGYAWWYERYAPRDRDLERLEESARAAGRGLWAAEDPIAPWDWRQGLRESREPRSGGPESSP